MKNEAIIE